MIGKFVLPTVIAQVGSRMRYKALFPLIVIVYPLGYVGDDEIGHGVELATSPYLLSFFSFPVYRIHKPEFIKACRLRHMIYFHSISFPINSNRIRSYPFLSYPIRRDGSWNILGIFLDWGWMFRFLRLVYSLMMPPINVKISL